MSRLDRAGVVLSAACAVHCVLLPFVAGLLPFLGLQHLVDERVEWLLVSLTALIGVAGHTAAYVRHHRHVGPGLLFVAGLGLVLVIRLSHIETFVEPAALGVGGVFLAAAHWMNLRLCRGCKSCVDTAARQDAALSCVPEA